MQAECAALRNMINCNVCHQRQKDVVITKCWHMFCNHCIQRNLGGWVVAVGQAGRQADCVQLVVAFTAPNFCRDSQAL